MIPSFFATSLFQLVWDARVWAASEGPASPFPSPLRLRGYEEHHWWAFDLGEADFESPGKAAAVPFDFHPDYRSALRPVPFFPDLDQESFVDRFAAGHLDFVGLAFPDLVFDRTSDLDFADFADFALIVINQSGLLKKGYSASLENLNNIKIPEGDEYYERFKTLGIKQQIH